MVPGFTIYICFGPYGGFGYRVDGPSFRICFGWVSICFAKYDVERTVVGFLKKNGLME